MGTYLRGSGEMKESDASKRCDAQILARVIVKLQLGISLSRKAWEQGLHLDLKVLGILQGFPGRQSDPHTASSHHTSAPGALARSHSPNTPSPNRLGCAVPCAWDTLVPKLVDYWYLIPRSSIISEKPSSLSTRVNLSSQHITPWNLCSLSVLSLSFLLQPVPCRVLALISGWPSSRAPWL